MHEFSTIGLREEIALALISFGFEKPTEIQRLAAPVVLASGSAYLSAATGTGKTFAYLAPILSKIDPESTDLSAVIVAPTHDLAAQIYRETEKLIQASGLPFRVAQALGSIPLARQLERLRDKPHILIGSAGRIRDLISSRYIHATACKWAVLDEGDRLFEKEVIEITKDLLEAVPADCARIMVSATIPDKIVDKTAEWFKDAARVSLDSTEALRTSIEHWCFHASSRSKTEFLRKFEAAVKPSRCLVFISTNSCLFTVSEKLEFLGIKAAVLKSDKDGTERKSAVMAFSAGEVRWLLTTDLGARGLDIPDVSHVISYDLPEEPSIYVHRAGRTGRAGKQGISISIADMVELKRASKIAVRYNFPFMCKILDSGNVHDIDPENFFALAEEDETNRKRVSLSKQESGGSPSRSGAPGRRTQGSAERPRSTTDRPRSTGYSERPRSPSNRSTGSAERSSGGAYRPRSPDSGYQAPRDGAVRRNPSLAGSPRPERIPFADRSPSAERAPGSARPASPERHIRRSPSIPRSGANTGGANIGGARADGSGDSAQRSPRARSEGQRPSGAAQRNNRRKKPGGDEGQKTEPPAT